MSQALTADQQEAYGKLVRQTWVYWAQQQPDPKPHWLTPWETLEEPQKDVDRLIGVVCFDQACDQLGVDALRGEVGFLRTLLEKLAEVSSGRDGRAWDRVRRVLAEAGY